MNHSVESSSTLINSVPVQPFSQQNQESAQAILARLEKAYFDLADRVLVTVAEKNINHPDDLLNLQVDNMPDVSGVGEAAAALIYAEISQTPFFKAERRSYLAEGEMTESRRRIMESRYGAVNPIHATLLDSLQSYLFEKMSDHVKGIIRLNTDESNSDMVAAARKYCTLNKIIAAPLCDSAFTKN